MEFALLCFGLIALGGVGLFVWVLVLALQSKDRIRSLESRVQSLELEVRKSSVQPAHAAFPELVGLSGGGVLCASGSSEALADAIEPLLLDPVRARTLGLAGQKSVREKFDAEQMAAEGPGVIQAGSVNKTSISIRDGFAGHPAAWRDHEIVYYAHEVKF